jgi:Putative peptidoglycan binding domain/NlpC/P60 family
MSTTIPLPRTLHMGLQGQDVGAMQRALHAWSQTVRPSGPTNVFGGPTMIQVKRFQQASGLPMSGRYGPETHAWLDRYFDLYGVQLMHDASTAIHPDKTLRQLVVAAAMLGYHNRGSIHYTQGPPRMQGVTQHLRPPSFPRYADCSSFATWCYYAAGASDPNERGYDGSGYTGTLYPHGVRVVTANPGDLVFYGDGTVPEHVTIAVGNGYVVSHGSEPGPLLLPQRYRNDEIGIRSYLPQ